jgi:Zn finger protein HypA/HybF involved in hydrogenase expression
MLRNSAFGFVMITVLSTIHTIINTDFLGLVETGMTVAVCIITYNHIIDSAKKLQELEDFVVQCAWCGSVRNAKEYIEAKISHTICPSCYDKQIGELTNEGRKSLPKM